MKQTVAAGPEGRQLLQRRRTQAGSPLKRPPSLHVMAQRASALSPGRTRSFGGSRGSAGRGFKRFDPLASSRDPFRGAAV
jgi:hypothetical protein